MKPINHRTAIPIKMTKQRMNIVLQAAERSWAQVQSTDYNWADLHTTPASLHDKWSAIHMVTLTCVGFHKNDMTPAFFEITIRANAIIGNIHTMIDAASRKAIGLHRIQEADRPEFFDKNTQAVA